jgi:hypothetical protein
MSSCQNQPPFSVSACGQAVEYLKSCLENVGSSYDNFIQYITEGSHLNTGMSSETILDPKFLQMVMMHRSTFNLCSAMTQNALKNSILIFLLLLVNPGADIV